MADTYITEEELKLRFRQVRMEHDTRIANKFVQKDGNKVLSDNNFTTAEKEKLNGIDTSQFATKDDLATIQGGGSGATIDTSQFATKTELQTAIDNVTVDTSNFATDTELQTAIDNVTVDTSQFATKTELQTAIDNVTVDTSNFATKDDLATIQGGGSGATIDTSQFATKTELQTAIDNVTVDTSNFVTDTELQTAIDNVTVDTSNFVQKDGNKVLSDNNYTTDEKNKLEDLAFIAEAGDNITIEGGVIKAAGVTTPTDFSYKGVNASHTTVSASQAVFNMPMATVNASDFHMSISRGGMAIKGGGYISFPDGYITGNPVFTGTPVFQGGVSGITAEVDWKNIPNATNSQAGLMSASDKTKIDNLDSTVLSTDDLYIPTTAFDSIMAYFTE